MVLQINNPRIVQLVTEAAERTGESPEAAIETALLERLARLPPRAAAPLAAEHADVEEAARRARISAAIRELQEAFQRHPEAIVDHAELLYDDNGLPR